MEQPERKDVFPLLFILAGVANLNILVFSLGLTNEAIIYAFPSAFSRVGMFAIVLWGLAYISVARNYLQVPWLCALFALEKFFYVGTWVYWLSTRGSTLGALYDKSILAGLFYSVYGVNDFIFGVVFLLAFRKAR